MPADTLQEQVVKYLTDAHSIEEQALAQMRAAPDLASDPGLAAAFKEHEAETERHEQLVRERLSELGAKPSRLKDAVMALGHQLEDPQAGATTRRLALEAAVKATSVLDQDPGLSMNVIIGQIRSTAIDLLRGSGLSGEEARNALDAAVQRAGAAGSRFTALATAGTWPPCPRRRDPPAHLRSGARRWHAPWPTSHTGCSPAPCG